MSAAIRAGLRAVCAAAILVAMPAARPEFVLYLEEVFAPLGAISVGRLFGGWQFRAGGQAFAMVIGETLYFRAEEPLRQALADAGSQPFRYAKRTGPVVVHRLMSAPDADIDDADALLGWARRVLG